ncbi:Diphthamide biosynthesis protein 4 [Lecanicillium sp. MT-2017a]|nr:Diphthamide biosynthesis protein 4 [Lecanicillium sp. MT-2017a]
MDGPSAGRPSRTPTHYQVLGLSPSILADQDPSSASSLIKKAYHRALLQNHPDKAKSAHSSSSTLLQISYTVDQISQAFNVLSAPRSRAEYDAALRVSRIAGAGEDGTLAARFQTGVENVDLDDLEVDEGEGKWFRSCRCGNDKGYTFQEADLEEASDDGVLMVGCHDCSLWLKVHFAVVDDDDNDGS